jgi:hypothetical protein
VTINCPFLMMALLLLLAGLILDQDTGKVIGLGGGAYVAQVQRGYVVDRALGVLASPQAMAVIQSKLAAA